MKPSARLLAGFSGFLLVYALINWFIGWNGFLFLSHLIPTVPETVFWLVFAVVAFGYLAGRAAFLGAPGRLLKVVGSYYFAVLEFAVLLLPLADLSAWLLRRAGYPPEIYIGMTGYAALGLLIVLLARGSRNAWNPVVRSYRAEVAKRAGGRERLRIAIASDIHLGNVVGNRHLRKLVRIVERMKPDLILLPGDVIDDSIEPFVRNAMGETLKDLRAPLGVYAVLGNHEYYGGHAEEYVRRMAEIGIRVLRDELVTVNGEFVIAGRKDKTAERMEPEGRLPVGLLLGQADKRMPIILMDHQPYGFDAAADAGADILLCGHTHRGQFAPNHWITGRLFELDWGYMRKSAMHVVVSSGFGTWGPPIRLASRSEVIELTVEFTGAPDE